MDLTRAGEHQFIQMPELEELRDQAYTNFVIYKAKNQRNCMINT